MRGRGRGSQLARDPSGQLYGGGGRARWRSGGRPEGEADRGDSVVVREQKLGPREVERDA